MNNFSLESEENEVLVGIDKENVTPQETDDIEFEEVVGKVDIDAIQKKLQHHIDEEKKIEEESFIEKAEDEENSHEVEKDEEKEEAFVEPSEKAVDEAVEEETEAEDELEEKSQEEVVDKEEDKPQEEKAELKVIESPDIPADFEKNVLNVVAPIIEVDASAKKYVVYIESDNIDFMENMSVPERRELINRILREQSEFMVKLKVLADRKKFLKHSILATVTFLIAFPILFILVNKAMEVSLVNYKQAKQNFIKLYKEQGKIKPKELNLD